MNEELTSIEQRIVAETFKGFLGCGVAMWFFAVLKLYYFDRLPDSLWNHT